MNPLANYSPVRRMTGDGLLLCLPAFFADLGYQGVAALFPLYVVFELHEPVYWYGIITAVAFGAGSFFSTLEDWQATDLTRNMFRSPAMRSYSS